MRPLAAVGILAIGAAASQAPVAPASFAHPRGYVCYRADGRIHVDGRLDEKAWSRAPWTEDFTDIEGDARPKPALRTRAKMLWDDAYLYIAADLVEPDLWATLTEHDSVIFHDNDFEFFIDPNGDSHEYYEFEINALGTNWDLLLPRPYKDSGKAVNDWEIRGLQSAVHLDGTLNDPRDRDRGWTIELAVPWEALGELARRRSPPGDGDQWRVNFSRVEWTLENAGGAYRKVAGRSEHNWVWSPQHVIDMHRPEQWGYLQFSSATTGTVAFEPDPSWPARRWLHQVYYAQRAYRETHGRWAASLAELAVANPDDPRLTRGSLLAADTVFDASVDLKLVDGSGERWHIRQDALIWPEEKQKGGSRQQEFETVKPALRAEENDPARR